MNYKDYIQDVVNWPVEGVLFKDITPLLANSNMFNAAIDDMSMFIDENVSIAGIESRGFIFGSAVATINECGFIPIRKAGKLPPPVESIDSTKEYGNEILEVKAGSGDVWIIDDVLATGGTLKAAETLLTMAGYNVLGAVVLIDLKYLHGEILVGGKPVHSLIQYNG